MLRSESLKSRVKIHPRTSVALFCAITFLTLLPVAFGQDFSLTMAPFPSPAAVDPGGASAANITLDALNGFSSTVALSCQVTSNPVAAEPPTCQVSPATVTPPGGASVTVTSTGLTTPTQYAITVTGTAGALTHSQSQALTVLSVAPQFTITIQTPVAPTSVPAGNGAEGTISINPLNGYTNPGVTLSCASISPLVTLPPVCSFNQQPVPVNGVPVTSTITITSAGPITTGANFRGGLFYAMWIPLPLLGLVGLGAAASGKRSRKAWGLLALFVLSGSLILTPGCGNSTTSTSTPNGVTPPNTYTFTILGVDTNGNISSNTTTTGTNPSVSLTVTAPTTTP